MIGGIRGAGEDGGLAGWIKRAGEGVFVHVLIIQGPRGHSWQRKSRSGS